MVGREMESLVGPFLIAAVVLALAGARKLADPAPTRGALRQMGLPWRGPVVPAMALAEIATAATAVVVGSWWSAAALAAWYVGFTVFVAVALRRDVPLASCGCLGSPDTPPTVGHLVVDGLFAATAIGVTLDPIGAIGEVLGDQPWSGLPLLLWVGVGTYIVYLVLAVLPQTVVATRSRSSLGTAGSS
jgi:hypothetical protein